MTTETATTLFPLGYESPRVCLEAFGGFDDQQMQLIMGSQAAMHEDTHPVGHLLSYKEDPFLAILHTKFGNDSELLPRERLYRAGVCVGATMIQRRINELQTAGQTLPELRVDPGRSYLVYPEAKTGEAFQRHYFETLWGKLDRIYLDPAVERSYFSGQTTIDQTRQLGDMWTQKGMDTLLDGRKMSEQQLLGQVCRGMFHVFRLYKILEQEAKIAPWTSTVYDPGQHIRIGTQRIVDGQDEELFPDPVPATSELCNYRRPVGYFESWGIRQLPDEADIALTIHRHVGDTMVPDHTLITEVGRGIAGYVQLDAGSKNSLIPVVFRKSLEVTQLTPNDELAYRRGDVYGTLDQCVAYSYGGDDTELLALLRNGKATMLHNLPGEELSEAMMVVLTHNLCDDQDASYTLSRNE